MYKSVEKVIAEYVFTMLKENKKVKGRVSEKMGGEGLKYAWAVSHFYRLNETAPAPIKPEKTECASREEAERLMYAYLRAYTGTGVEANPNY